MAASRQSNGSAINAIEAGPGTKKRDNNGQGSDSDLLKKLRHLTFVPFLSLEPTVQTSKEASFNEHELFDMVYTCSLLGAVVATYLSHVQMIRDGPCMFLDSHLIGDVRRK